MNGQDIVWDEDIAWDTPQEIAPSKPEIPDFISQYLLKHAPQSYVGYESVKGAVEPLMRSILPRSIIEKTPSATPSMILPYYLQQSMPEPIRKQMAEESAGYVTSPLGIVSSLATLKAETGRPQLPKIMTEKWRLSQPKEAVNIIDNTIKDYRTSYEKIFEPYNKNEIMVGDTYKDLGLENTASLESVWDKRNEILKSIYETSWDKSDLFQKLRVGQEQAIKLAGQLKELVLNNLPEEVSDNIRNLDIGYEKAIKLGGFLKRKMYNPKSETYKFSTLAEIFKNKEKVGEREAFGEFSFLNPAMRQVISNMKKYSGREKTKNILTKLATIGILGNR